MTELQMTNLGWNRRDVGVFKYLYSPNKHVCLIKKDYRDN